MSEIKVNSVVNSTGDNDSGLDLSTNDKIGIKIANAEVATVDTTGVVFNDASADRDFRVESNGEANMLFVDGGNDKVGIGTSSPANKLHLNESTSGGNYLQVTNSTTGATSSDGLIVGLGASEDAYVWQYENQALIFATNNTERMRLLNGGNLSIGLTTSLGKLHVASDGSATTPCFFQDTRTGSTSTTCVVINRNGSNVGAINTTNTSTAYVTSSDHRLKENVEDMTGAIDRVKQLLPKRFNFIADADTTVDGFLAHEAQSVVAEAVTGTHNEVDDDGEAVMQGIDQAKLVPLLTGALKEAIAKIEALETRITALENAE